MAAGTALTRPAVQPGRAGPARRWHRPWLLAWLAFAPVAVLRAGVLTESDTFWQIRAGLLTLAHRAIPATDTFSWTVHGRPWTLNSWAFDVFLALAYRLAGLPGVAWACAGLGMAVAGLMLLLARCLGASPLAAGVLLLAGAPLLAGWLTARPQLADYLAVIALVLLLRRVAAGQGRGQPVVAAGLLSAVWVNLHAGALIGVVIPAACAVALLVRGPPKNRARAASGSLHPDGKAEEERVAALRAMTATPPAGMQRPASRAAVLRWFPRRERRMAGWWCAAVAAAALAGSLASPYGTGVFHQALQVQGASAGLIAEWQHVDPASPVQLLTVAAGLLALLVAARRRDAVLTAAVGVTTAGSVVAVRFLPFVVLLAVPVLAACAAQPPAPVLRYLRSRRVMFARCGTAGLVAWAAVAVPSLAHIGRPDPAVYPAGIVADIPAGCRLFNSYLLGGYVILQRPDVPVSLDSRNDLYGRRLLLAGERTLQGDGSLASGLRGAGCVLVPPAYELARRLARDPGWQVRAAGPAAVLFVRR